MAILENVLGLVRLNPNAFLRVIELLRSFGYKTEARVLNTMHFGVAQSRKRVYVVAIRRDSLSSLCNGRSLGPSGQTRQLT